VSPVRFVCSLHCNLETEPSSSQKDVHDTLVSNGWETGLLVDIITDV